MRRATYAIPGANGSRGELAVTAFPGNVGGNLANVNRWRGQIELDMVDEAELKNLIKPLDLPAGKATLVEMMDGTDAKSRGKAALIGVVFAHHGQTWFFKMLGDTRIVEREKAAFLKFVQSVKFPNA